MTYRRPVLVVILVVSAALLAWAIVWNPSKEAQAGPATDLNVIVLGVDGLDWFLIGKYVDEGLLPNFTRVLRSAIKGDVTADHPTLPQVGWTIMGRGRPLTEAESATVSGQGDRRLFGVAPDLAALVESAGGRAVAVGWPASWPLVSGDESVVAPYAPDAAEHTRSLAPALFEGAPGQTSETTLGKVVDEAVRRNLETIDTDFASDIHAGGGDGDLGSEDLTAVKWSYLADRTTMDVAGRLIAEREPDLAMVYLGGLDAAVHRFVGQAMPEYFEGVALPNTSCSDVVPNYYRFVDDALGRLLRLTDERSFVIVVSAYGVHPSVAAPPSTGGHELDPPGMIMFRGPHLPRHGRTLEVATVDIAPTVLATLGLPMPPDLGGRVLADAVPEGLLEAYPPRILASSRDFAESVPTPPECAPMNNRVKERLAELRVAPGR